MICEGKPSSRLARALERFSFASWRLLVAKGGNAERIYSPYSAFTSMLMVALLAKGTTKAELLKALQIEIEGDGDTEALADEMADFLLETEFAPQFYNPSFDDVLSVIAGKMNVRLDDITVTQKVWMYVNALRHFGGDRAITWFTESLKAEQMGTAGACRMAPRNPVFESFCNRLSYVECYRFSLSGANRLWPNKGMNLDMSEFAILTDTLKTPVEPVSFPEPGLSEINRYVEEVTGGLIRDFLSLRDVGADTQWILTNAVCFNAEWSEKFERDIHVPTTWKGLDGSVKELELMRHMSAYQVLGIPEAKMIALPYSVSDYSMIIVLPDDFGEEAFNRVSEMITGETLASVVASAKTKNVEVQMPKFEAVWRDSLVDVFEGLGAREIFTENANFVGRSSISKVVQKARIIVDEKGTVASAATAIGVMGISLCEITEFICDHPFMYFIRNDVNGSILFMGSCIDPVSQ